MISKSIYTGWRLRVESRAGELDAYNPLLSDKNLHSRIVPPMLQYLRGDEVLHLGIGICFPLVTFVRCDIYSES